MLAGAIQQYLKTQGLSPVMVGSFGDYKTAGPAAYVIHAEPGQNAELDTGSYEAVVQLRTRAASLIDAENAARVAFALILAADGETLPWTDPGAGPDREYQLEAILALQRPTWYPTPEPGEETSCNFRLFVTEL